MKQISQVEMQQVSGGMDDGVPIIWIPPPMPDPVYVPPVVPPPNYTIAAPIKNQP